MLRILQALGALRRVDGEAVLTPAGAYWVHLLQNVVSISGIGTLWGTSVDEPWPERVVLG